MKTNSEAMSEGKKIYGGTHNFLDVYSVQQGILRLRIFQYSILAFCFLGFYLSLCAILNYSGLDADARDIITNMRLLIGGYDIPSFLALLAVSCIQVLSDSPQTPAGA
jgi:hypothetical protein